jgi:NAD(P)-dependent dehydrogenase (short-subunit alcohol dehydrogenase family)
MSPGDPSQTLDVARRLASTPLADLLAFDDSAVVVTGGASGIGYAIAARFAAQGAAVVVVDRDEEALRTATDAGFAAVVADVGDAGALDQVALDAFGSRRRLVWVNSAGIYPTHLLAELDDDAWQRVIDVNLTGTMKGARAAVRAMRAVGGTGVVINLSSVAGARAGSPPGIHHYAASKHGVEGLTKSLAVEVGPEGIRVVAIAPGVVVTEGLSAKYGDDEVFLRMARSKPLRRPSLPDDIARVAVFLASPLAAMVTGCTIPVDGGHRAL